MSDLHISGKGSRGGEVAKGKGEEELESRRQGPVGLAPNSLLAMPWSKELFLQFPFVPHLLKQTEFRNQYK